MLFLLFLEVVVDILLEGVFVVVVGWRGRCCCLEDNVVVVDERLLAAILLTMLMMLIMLKMMDVGFWRLHPHGKCGVFYHDVMSELLLVR